ncbi:hypothetical protein ASG47_07115 [Devosia sp. Leaf420]|uniref:Gfo/Idh/MocA family protein n=1 Tax=Devosia sp. Leaf420 TaxID=1736374 RepID=UPI000713F001|nr:Gfo/Idh/MocA family oxidoreductase [Devosia sp. Leaf420]KQT48136.1 hypothetical protein ASG47_07115 [Devosia sp. Leaf420]
MTRIPIAVVGAGKIAQDEHIPSILASDRFSLVAVVSSREVRVPDVPVFGTMIELLAQMPTVQAISVCTPPSARAELVREALEAGKHVLMEKPPVTTLSELEALQELANERSQVLFQAWHSQHNKAVLRAKKFLLEHGVVSLRILWRENVRQWHYGQDWIWQPGGFGVCDPGVNALSILTRVMPYPVFVSRSRLVYPSNRQAPGLVDIEFTSGRSESGTMTATFDWLAEDEEVWELHFHTKDGHEVVIEGGGRRLRQDGVVVEDQAPAEYRSIYERFAHLLETGESDVDAAPFRLMSDVFFKGAIETAPEFHW